MQQSTLPLSPSHPLKGVQGLGRQIALPHEFAPERFPSFPALERTAVMSFCQPTTLDTAVGRETKVVAFRQAAFPIWVDRLFNNDYAYGATWSSTLITDEIDITYQFPSGNLAWVNRQQISGQLGRNPTYSGTTAMPNSYVPLGIDANTGSRPWLYVPAGFTYYLMCCFNQSPLPAQSGYVEIMYEAWQTPGQVQTMQSVGRAWASDAETTINMTGIASTGMWIRPTGASVQFGPIGVPIAGFTANIHIAVTSGVMTSFTNTPSGGSFTCSNINNYALWPAIDPAEFSNSRMPWYATRTTACGLLCSNVSQVLNKAGTVLAGRLSPNVVNAFSCTSADVNNLHPAEKAWLPLETGFYTYVPPSTDLQSFWDYTATSFQIVGPVVELPVFRLDNDAMYNVAYFTPGAVAETMALTIDWHVEFRTSSALFQIGLCGMTLESLHQAQLALSSVGFFFENPEHKSILNKVTAAVKKYGPQVVDGLSTVTPYGKVLKMGMNAFQNKSINMKPTSAASSGITNAKNEKKKRPKKVVVIKKKPSNKKR